jgi:hypothetical protein
VEIVKVRRSRRPNARGIRLAIAENVDGDNPQSLSTVEGFRTEVSGEECDDVRVSVLAVEQQDGDLGQLGASSPHERRERSTAAAFPL